VHSSFDGNISVLVAFLWWSVCI